jgi:predicted nucleotidyltransferase
MVAKFLLDDPDALMSCKLSDFCRQNRISRLAVFGSAARGRLRDELSKIFGRTVDLNTPRCLPEEFRDQVRQEAHVLYAAP